MTAAVIRWGQKIHRERALKPLILNAMFGTRREAMMDLGFAFNPQDWGAGYKQARKHGYRVIRISVREHGPRGRTK